MYAMIALLSEGKYDVIIPAPNGKVEARNLRPLRSELPSVWSDISKAMRGFEDHSLHMLVLDEVLGLKLSNFSRQLKLKPRIDDDHRVIVGKSNDLWLRGMEIKKEGGKRHNAKVMKAHLKAMILRMKPEANKWLHLTPRIAALGMNAFERGPAIITKIRAHLVKELKLAENAEQKSAEFIDRMWQITIEALWTENVRGEEGFERTDSTSEGLGAGWTASFLAKSYPGFSRYLTNEFLKAVVEFFIVVILGLFVTFGVENFVKRPAVLLSDGIQILRLDGILTLIAITHGNLGALINLTRYPEQMRENVKKIDTKRSTTSWTKIWDPRHSDQKATTTVSLRNRKRYDDRKRRGCATLCGGMTLLTNLSLTVRTDPLALIRGVK